MKLANKMFVAFAVPTVLTVAMLLVLWQAGLNRSFYRFIEQVDSAPLIAIEETLLGYYREARSWDRLRAEPGLWQALGDREQRDPGGQQDPGDRRPRGLGNPPPGSGQHDTLHRVSLYDGDRNVIVGRADIDENPIVRELRVDGELIGYTGLVPERQLAGGPDREMLQRQLSVGVASGLAALALALAVAWSTARHLTRPVGALSQAAARLREGDLAWRAAIDTGDEIQLLADDINALAEKLQDGETLRRKWTSNIAHELRTPITVLRSQCEAMLDRVVTTNEYRLERLVAETYRLERLVEDLYQLSLFESDSLHLEKSWLMLDELLESRVRQYAERFEKAGLELNVDYKARRCRFLGDAHRLAQVFDNLLENSLRYTDRPGQLAVSLGSENGGYLILFEDSEPGVPANAREQLFERLYRVEQSRNRSRGGSGLGLALVKALVEVHGGRITCTESKLGGIAIQMRFDPERFANG